MFETSYGDVPHGPLDSTMREPRSGFSGFGGRPSLHPAWRDDAAANTDAQTAIVIVASSR